MKKILFKIGSVEIISDLRWIGQGQPLITEMTDTHIQNTRCWLYRQIQSIKALGYAEPVQNGFTYSEWLSIFAKEEDRRKEIVQKEKEEKIEKLKFKTLSVREKKNQAKKLLASPHIPGNIELAEKLLNLI